jgi:hypothetical protein
VPTIRLTAAPPLIFLRPVGFDPASAMTLLQLAGNMDAAVRWRLPPPGQEPDAYIAPEGALGLPALEYRDTGSDTQPDASMLQLDDNGWYKGRPVCVLRSHIDPPTPTDTQDTQNMQDDLAHGLRLTALLLGRTRALYTVAAQAWCARPDLAPGITEWRAQGRLLATVDTARWQVWLYPGLEPEQLAHASIGNADSVSAPECVGFECLPLEWLLWSLAQRCDEALLQHLLPERFLHLPIVHRRPSTLSRKQLGRHGKAVLQITEMHAKTAQQLRHALGLSEPALWRVLAGLALTRAIQVEHPGRWHHRLRHRLHHLLARWLQN